MSKAQNLLFIQSIISKDTSKASQILSKGANINAIGSEHISALHYATLDGDLESCKWLLEHGASIFVKSTNGGQNPIHLACMKGNLEALELFFTAWEKMRAEAKQSDAEGEAKSAPVESSTKDKSEPPTKKRRLNSTGSTSVEDTLGTVTVTSDDYFANVQDEIGWTPLICAASFAQIRTMEWLLAHGAQINLTDHKQRTALQFILVNANQTIDPVVVEFLLEHGCDPNHQDKDKRTALHLAVAHDREIPILRLLILYGIDTNAKDKRGNTAEKIAREMSKEKVADFIETMREIKISTEWMLQRHASGKGIPVTKSVEK